MKILIKIIALLSVVLAVSCTKDDNTESGGNIGQTKTITWEKYLDFSEIGETRLILNFAISGNGNYIYYSTNNRSIYRYNLATKEKDLLYGG